MFLRPWAACRLLGLLCGSCAPGPSLGRAWFGYALLAAFLHSVPLGVGGEGDYRGSRGATGWEFSIKRCSPPLGLFIFGPPLPRGYPCVSCCRPLALPGPLSRPLPSRPALARPSLRLALGRVLWAVSVVVWLRPFARRPSVCPCCPGPCVVRCPVCPLGCVPVCGPWLCSS